MLRPTILLVCTLALLSSCSTSESNTATTDTAQAGPVAKKIAHEMQEHGKVRTDDYFWMRLTDEQKEATTPDAQTQDVLDYLNAENAYQKEVLAHTDTLQKELFDEIVSRIKQDDSSVPYKLNGYLYYDRFETGQDYPLYCRKQGSEKGKEEIMLNVPELARGHAYYQVGGQDVSTNTQLLGYAVDTVSRRQYTVFFKDLKSGAELPDQLTGVDGGVTWANDNTTVFYTVQDTVTLRSYRIYKHTLGTPQSADGLVYEEADETFGTYVYKTKSEKYIVIASRETLTSEYRVLEANNPNGEFRIIQPRVVGLEYNIDHFGDHFFIRTNMDATNFKLMRTPVNATTKENWTDVIPHRSDVLLSDVELFKDYLVLSERKNGLLQIRMKRWDNTSDTYMEFNDPTYAAYVSFNPEINTNELRYYYTSMTTPGTTYAYDMKTAKRTLLKQQEVLGGKFDPANYASERLFATATDGTKVPISIVYRKGMERNGKNPLLLYGYGSYGASMDASFSSTRLSLLDRGFVYAIAHIRGGQEMGRHWYEDGKLLTKKNTFTDFIDCGKFLVKEGITSPEHLYCHGGSAGGLLVGAVVNMAPDLFHGGVAEVPFVDVVSTMWDESIPLTTGEFNEWGNPQDAKYYDYIRSYSPYDNVVAQNYPNMLVTTGYWDSQVQYWEPAKWVAKLRATKTGDQKLIMYCNMDVGHGGASGRFESYKKVALVYAFLLDLEGITK
ncbi:MAG: S9 family peptidase [Flavobacteriales bacterium]|nr:S9 family peptidase [Flavobacteriales bacterium]MBK6945598.1 S9 family peptidase [Flavobacteriales bacterium]MBP9137678.1 S9 family peptidase [Flavobacteriales bacterium]HQV53680.1 S9 family peptidase [Flavobacteriales bacterium]HQX30527.1 S9 family peptidase [Flavobacteriales bacterium]